MTNNNDLLNGKVSKQDHNNQKQTRRSFVDVMTCYWHNGATQSSYKCIDEIARS